MNALEFRFFYTQYVKQEQKRKNIFGGNIPLLLSIQWSALNQWIFGNFCHLPRFDLKMVP